MGEQTNLRGRCWVKGIIFRILITTVRMLECQWHSLQSCERGNKWRWRREGITVWTTSLSKDKMASSHKWRGSLGWEYWQVTHNTKEWCKFLGIDANELVGGMHTRFSLFQLFLILSAVTYLDNRTWEKLLEVWGKRKVWNNHEIGEKGLNR